MKATFQNGETVKIVQVYPFYPEFQANITVARHREGGIWKPADINWAGCGSQRVEYACMFRLAFDFALYAANALNAERFDILTKHPDVIHA